MSFIPFQKMGAWLTTAESVILSMVGDSRLPQFKLIQALIREKSLEAGLKNELHGLRPAEAQQLIDLTRGSPALKPMHQTPPVHSTLPGIAPTFKSILNELLVAYAGSGNFPMPQ